MSAKRPITEVASSRSHFRCVPKGDIGGFPNRTAMWHIAMPVTAAVTVTMPPNEVFILGLVEAEPDITLVEVGERLVAERSISAVPSMIWLFFERRGMTFRKRLHKPPSRNARM